MSAQPLTKHACWLDQDISSDHKPVCRPLQVKSTEYKAFTLIELLVVISIISLLISILLPALAAAKKSGDRVACLSNQKQLGTALYNYSIDHYNYYPTLNANANISQLPGSSDYWHVALAYQKYVNQDASYAFSVNDGKPIDSIWTCRSENLPRPGLPGATSGSWTGTHYGLNQYIAGFFGGSVTPAVRVDDVNNPSQTFILADNGRLSAAGYALRRSGTLPGIKARHMGSANTLQVDGHAETATDELIMERTSATYNEQWWNGNQ